MGRHYIVATGGKTRANGALHSQFANALRKGSEQPGMTAHNHVHIEVTVNIER